MRELSSSVATALLRSACLAVVIAAGCGGGSGGGEGKLEGNDAVEAAIGVVSSTAKALPLVFLDVDLEVRALAVRSAAALGRRVANGETGGSPFSCEGGGSYRVGCSIDARGETRLDIEYNGCTEGEDPVRRREGTLSVRALDPGLCLAGDFRDDRPFSFELSGFRSTLSDAEGSEIARLDADLTESINPEPGGCFTLDGTRTVSGTLAVRSASDIDLAVEAQDLGFEVASDGEPCEQRITANGGFDVDDRAAGRRFAQTFDDAVFALSSDGALVAVSIGGTVSNSCIGDVELTSDEPLQNRADSKCPVGGALRLAFADGAAAIVRFTESGGADIDFDANGGIDESFASCFDGSLARCAR